MSKIISAIQHLDERDEDKVIDGIVVLGLTPGLLSILALEKEMTIRKWAAAHIKACRTSPLSIQEWESLDFPSLWNDIIRLPYEGVPHEEQDEEQIKRWLAVSKVLESGSLSEEVVRGGVLDLTEDVGNTKKKSNKEGRSLIVDVAGSLSKTSPGALQAQVW